LPDGVHYRAFLAVALLMSGCAGRVGLPERSASATAGGVEVAAAVGAWRGWPAQLDRVVTPVRISVTNHGDAPVRLDATTFGLALAKGARLAAMLPADVRGVVAAPAPAALPGAGLALGPTREGSGPGWAINDPALDPRTDPTVEPDRTWELPSADMRDLALPEGVLAPGRTASGFVYFERAPRGTGPVTLKWPVVDARSGETVGAIELPLTLP
jgi:hypothetical protein